MVYLIVIDRPSIECVCIVLAALDITIFTTAMLYSIVPLNRNLLQTPYYFIPIMLCASSFAGPPKNARMQLQRQELHELMANRAYFNHIHPFRSRFVKMGKPKVHAPTFKSVDTPYNVTKKSGYVMEGIVTSREGEPMVGPVIIWAHGTLSSANHNFTDELSHKLSNELGLSSYRFNFRFDKSEAEPEHRYRYSGYADDVDDLEAVVAALRSDGYTPWCFFGHSRGSNDVLLYTVKHTVGAAALDDDVECKSEIDSIPASTSPLLQFQPNSIAVVLTAPRFDMTCMSKTIFSPEQLEAAHTTGTAAWPTQRGDLHLLREDLVITDNQMDMGRVMESIPAEVPILLLHGTDDELIPVLDANAFKKARPSIDVSIVDGARHAFRGKKQNKALLGTVTEWMAATYARIGGNIVVPECVAAVSSDETDFAAVKDLSLTN